MLPKEFSVVINRPSLWKKFTSKWFGHSHRSARPLYRKDIFYHQSIETLPEYEGKDPKEWTAQDAIEYRLSMMSIPPQISSDQSCWKLCSKSLLHGLGLLFDMSLLNSYPFLLIMSAYVLFLFGMLPTYVYLTGKIIDFMVSDHFKGHVASPHNTTRMRLFSFYTFVICLMSFF